jgi:hypothetical protein
VLPNVTEQQQHLVDNLLESNGRVREDYQLFRGPAAPHIGQTQLLPEVLGRVSRFPTLVHRLLRQPGNAAAVVPGSDRIGYQ